MGRFVGQPLPFGVTEYKDYVNFSVSAPRKSNCELLLYKKGQKEEEETFSLTECENAGDVRYIALPKRILRGREYVYRIDGEFVVDPYVKELCVCEDQVRGKVLLDAFDWEGDVSPRIPTSEVVAYSLHVRGFTKHKSSGVKHKGVFKGIVEKIPYLKELGINQIQCMPIYAFFETESYTNYWGYGDGYYFAPHPKYAFMKSPVRELKDMIKACHQAGIEVVLHMPFGEETTPQMAIDCLRYYVMEYHVDGFVLEPDKLSIKGAKADPMLGSVKLLEQKLDFQMDVRRFLRGDDSSMEGILFWTHQHSDDIGAYNNIAVHNGFTLADVFSYNEKHNEANGENNQDGRDYNCSYNCGAEGPTKSRRVKQLRSRLVRNAFFMLLTSQGTPVILSGDEFGNSQGGNNNVYCQDNEIAWLDWKQVRKEKELLDYVKNLIALRKKYPIIHLNKLLSGKDLTGCGVPDFSFHSELAWQAPSGRYCQSGGVYYHHEVYEIEDCFVAYNTDESEQIIALPALNRRKKWHLVMSTEGEDVKVTEELLDNQRSITLAGREMAIYIGK